MPAHGVESQRHETHTSRETKGSVQLVDLSQMGKMISKDGTNAMA